MWLLLCVLIMLVAQVVLCFAGTSVMLGLIPMMGLAYGGVFGLAPSLVSERFGQRHFGVNYGLAATAPALGSLVFSTLVAGKLADHFAGTSSITVVAADGEHATQCTGGERKKKKTKINKEEETRRRVGSGGADKTKDFKYLLY